MSAETWHKYFLAMAEFVSTKSKDPSTKTGAVIVRPDWTVASTGYNGFPRDMDDSVGLYEDRQLKYSRIIHCEMNAILTARESVEGYTLYTWPFASCDRCAVHVIQAGIARVIYPPLPSHLKDRWGDSLVKTLGYFHEAGVETVCL